jgi:hypothetical protein
VNRREFLKRIYATGIALAVPVTAFPPVTRTIPFQAQGFDYETDCGPPREVVTMAFMQTCYGTLWYGNERPTLIVMHPSRWKEITDKVPREQQLFNPKRKFKSVRFNDADMAEDQRVPDSVVWFINEKYPNDPKRTRCFQIKEKL